MRLPRPKRIVARVGVAVSLLAGPMAAAETPLFQLPDSAADPEAEMRELTKGYLGEALSPSWTPPSEIVDAAAAVEGRVATLEAAMSFLTSSERWVLRTRFRLEAAGDETLAQLDHVLRACEQGDADRPHAVDAPTAADMATLGQALKRLLAGEDVAATTLDAQFDRELARRDVQGAARRLTALQRRVTVSDEVEARRRQHCATFAQRRTEVAEHIANALATLAEREDQLDLLSSRVVASAEIIADQVELAQATAELVPVLASMDNHFHDHESGLADVVQAIDLPSPDAPEAQLIEKLDVLLRDLSRDPSKLPATAATPQLTRDEILDLITQTEATPPQESSK